VCAHEQSESERVKADSFHTRYDGSDVPIELRVVRVELEMRNLRAFDEYSVSTSSIARVRNRIFFAQA
jgi:hypothetical protein